MKRETVLENVKGKVKVHLLRKEGIASLRQVINDSKKGFPPLGGNLFFKDKKV